MGFTKTQTSVSKRGRSGGPLSFYKKLGKKGSIATSSSSKAAAPSFSRSTSLNSKLSEIGLKKDKAVVESAGSSKSPIKAAKTKPKEASVSSTPKAVKLIDKVNEIPSEKDESSSSLPETTNENEDVLTEAQAESPSFDEDARPEEEAAIPKTSTPNATSPRSAPTASSKGIPVASMSSGKSSDVPAPAIAPPKPSIADLHRASLFQPVEAVEESWQKLVEAVDVPITTVTAASAATFEKSPLDDVFSVDHQKQSKDTFEDEILKRLDEAEPSRSEPRKEPITIPLEAVESSPSSHPSTPPRDSFNTPSMAAAKTLTPGSRVKQYERRGFKVTSKMALTSSMLMSPPLPRIPHEEEPTWTVPPRQGVPWGPGTNDVPPRLGVPWGPGTDDGLPDKAPFLPHSLWGGNSSPSQADSGGEFSEQDFEQMDAERMNVTEPEIENSPSPPPPPPSPPPPPRVKTAHHPPRSSQRSSSHHNNNKRSPISTSPASGGRSSGKSFEDVHDKDSIRGIKKVEPEIVKKRRSMTQRWVARAETSASPPPPLSLGEKSTASKDKDERLTPPPPPSPPSSSSSTTKMVKFDSDVLSPPMKSKFKDEPSKGRRSLDRKGGWSREDVTTKEEAKKKVEEKKVEEMKASSQEEDAGTAWIFDDNFLDKIIGESTDKTSANGSTGETSSATIKTRKHSGKSDDDEEEEEEEEESEDESEDDDSDSEIEKMEKRIARIKEKLIMKEERDKEKEKEKENKKVERLKEKELKRAKIEEEKERENKILQEDEDKKKKREEERQQRAKKEAARLEKEAHEKKLAAAAATEAAKVKKSAERRSLPTTTLSGKSAELMPSKTPSKSGTKSFDLIGSIIGDNNSSPGAASTTRSDKRIDKTKRVCPETSNEMLRMLNESTRPDKVLPPKPHHKRMSTSSSVERHDSTTTTPKSDLTTKEKRESISKKDPKSSKRDPEEAPKKESEAFKKDSEKLKKEIEKKKVEVEKSKKSAEKGKESSDKASKGKEKTPSLKEGEGKGKTTSLKEGKGKKSGSEKEKVDAPASKSSEKEKSLKPKKSRTSIIHDESDDEPPPPPPPPPPKREKFKEVFAKTTKEMSPQLKTVAKTEIINQISQSKSVEAVKAPIVTSSTKTVIPEPTNAALVVPSIIEASAILVDLSDIPIPPMPPTATVESPVCVESKESARVQAASSLTTTDPCLFDINLDSIPLPEAPAPPNGEEAQEVDMEMSDDSNDDKEDKSEIPERDLVSPDLVPPGVTPESSPKYYKPKETTPVLGLEMTSSAPVAISVQPTLAPATPSTILNESLPATSDLPAYMTHVPTVLADPSTALADPSLPLNESSQFSVRPSIAELHRASIFQPAEPEHTYAPVEAISEVASEAANKESIIGPEEESMPSTAPPTLISEAKALFSSSGFQLADQSNASFEAPPIEHAQDQQRQQNANISTVKSTDARRSMEIVQRIKEKAEEKERQRAETAKKKPTASTTVNTGVQALFREYGSAVFQKQKLEEKRREEEKKAEEKRKEEEKKKAEKKAEERKKEEKRLREEKRKKLEEEERKREEERKKREEERLKKEKVEKQKKEEEDRKKEERRRAKEKERERLSTKKREESSKNRKKDRLSSSEKVMKEKKVERKLEKSDSAASDTPLSGSEKSRRESKTVHKKDAPKAEKSKQEKSLKDKDRRESVKLKEERKKMIVESDIEVESDDNRLIKSKKPQALPKNPAAAPGESKDDQTDVPTNTAKSTDPVPTKEKSPMKSPKQPSIKSPKPHKSPERPKIASPASESSVATPKSPSAKSPLRSPSVQSKSSASETRTSEIKTSSSSSSSKAPDSEGRSLFALYKEREQEEKIEKVKPANSEDQSAKAATSPASPMKVIIDKLVDSSPRKPSDIEDNILSDIDAGFAKDKADSEPVVTGSSKTVYGGIDLRKMEILIKRLSMEEVNRWKPKEKPSRTAALGPKVKFTSKSEKESRKQRKSERKSQENQLVENEQDGNKLSENLPVETQYMSVERDVALESPEVEGSVDSEKRSEDGEISSEKESRKQRKSERKSQENQLVANEQDGKKLSENLPVETQYMSVERDVALESPEVEGSVDSEKGSEDGEISSALSRYFQAVDDNVTGHPITEPARQEVCVEKEPTEVAHEETVVEQSEDEETEGSATISDTESSLMNQKKDFITCVNISENVSPVKDLATRKRPATEPDMTSEPKSVEVNDDAPGVVKVATAHPSFKTPSGDPIQCILVSQPTDSLDTVEGVSPSKKLRVQKSKVDELTFTRKQMHRLDQIKTAIVKVRTQVVKQSESESDFELKEVDKTTRRSRRGEGESPNVGGNIMVVNSRARQSPKKYQSIRRIPSDLVLVAVSSALERHDEYKDKLSISIGGVEARETSVQLIPELLTLTLQPSIAEKSLRDESCDRDSTVNLPSPSKTSPLQMAYSCILCGLYVSEQSSIEKHLTDEHQPMCRPPWEDWYVKEEAFLSMSCENRLIATKGTNFILTPAVTLPTSISTLVVDDHVSNEGDHASSESTSEVTETATEQPVVPEVPEDSIIEPVSEMVSMEPSDHLVSVCQTAVTAEREQLPSISDDGNEQLSDKVAPNCSETIESCSSIPPAESTNLSSYVPSADQQVPQQNSELIISLTCSAESSEEKQSAVKSSSGSAWITIKPKRSPRVTSSTSKSPSLTHTPTENPPLAKGTDVASVQIDSQSLKAGDDGGVSLPRTRGLSVRLVRLKSVDNVVQHDQTETVYGDNERREREVHAPGPNTIETFPPVETNNTAVGHIETDDTISSSSVSKTVTDDGCVANISVRGAIEASRQLLTDSLESSVIEATPLSLDHVIRTTVDVTGPDDGSLETESDSSAPDGVKNAPSDPSTTQGTKFTIGIAGINPLTQTTEGQPGR